MKILLVRANSKWRATYIPIGMGYIASAVRKEGHEVSILDARLKRLSHSDVIKYIQDIQPDVVGLSAVHMNHDIEGTRELCTELAQIKRQFTIVLGGPLGATLGGDFVSEGLVDAVIVGEGEVSFCRYLDALKGEISFQDVPGLLYTVNGEIITNPQGEFIKDIDNFVPAWDLNDPSQYFSVLKRSNMNLLTRHRKVMPIFTSRGCPFRCIYCHNMFGSKFRPRSVEAVLEEMSMLKNEYGIEEIDIVDDCFNLDLDRAKAIAKGMIDRKLNLAIAFPNALRVDRMDEELVDLLKEAGTHHVRYAIESASPRIQKMIHKNVNLEKAEQIIDYTANKGILTIGYFMFGFPTETEEEMAMTLDYALRSKFHAAYFFYATAFPGTELARNYLTSGSNENNVDNIGYFSLQQNLSAVSDEVLNRMMRNAYRRFYFSFRRILRTGKVAPKNLQTFLAVNVIMSLSIKDRLELW